MGRLTFSFSWVLSVWFQFVCGYETTHFIASVPLCTEALGLELGLNLSI